MSGIVGILLAAGKGRRFGSHKLLHPLASGESIGEVSARKLVTVVPRSLAVIASGDTELAEKYGALGLQVVENAEVDRGMGRSMAVGVAASADATGWLVALSDMPWIQPRTIESVANELARGVSLIAPAHKGHRGHPVGFNCKWQSRLERLTGDQGARKLLAEHASELKLLVTEDAGVLADVDRRTDLHDKWLHRAL